MMDEPNATPMGNPEPSWGDVPKDAPWFVRWIVPPLVDNWRQAWRWASVWIPGAFAIAAEAYGQNQPAVDQWIADNIPHTWIPHLLALGSMLIIYARLRKQKG